MSYLEKCMKSDELGLIENENSESSNDAWALFQSQFNLPLNKTSLLSLVVDIMKKKATTQRQKLREMLKLHLSSLDSKHGLDQIMSSTDKLIKANTMKILFASLKMLLERAEINLESLIESNKSDSDGLHQVVDDALLALSTVIRFQHILWRPNRGSDWSLPKTTLEVRTVHGPIIPYQLQLNDVSRVRPLESYLVQCQFWIMPYLPLKERSSKT